MTYLNNLKSSLNKTTTENGAITNSSTLNNHLDLFAQISSMRNLEEQQIINQFMGSYQDDKLTALRILFHARDILQGQGERKTFRIILSHLAHIDPENVIANIHNIPTYGRYDDLLILLQTPCEPALKTFLQNQIESDLNSDSPSLLAKWLPSEKAGSTKSKRLKRIKNKLDNCNNKVEKRQLQQEIDRINNQSKEVTLTPSQIKSKKIMKLLNMTPKEYRQTLTKLREKIGTIVEIKMSANKWGEIDYSTVHSKANLKYYDAFNRHDGERHSKYLDDIISGESKINSKTLYPYEIIKPIINETTSYYFNTHDGLNDKEKEYYNQLWKALPDYINDDKTNSLAVIDVSGSMNGTPMEVAVSLGLYLSEKNKGAFGNHFITFSEEPKLIEIKGDNLYDKVKNIVKSEWGYNTNLEKVFDILLDTAIKNNASQKDMPTNLYIISDMEFDEAVDDNDDYDYNDYNDIKPTKHSNQTTLMKTIKNKYESAGYKLPKLIFWNVDARNKQFPMDITQEGFQLISGFSPTIFQHTIAGKYLSATELMQSILNSPRYEDIVIS